VAAPPASEGAPTNGVEGPDPADESVRAEHAERRGAEASAARLQAMVAGLNAVVWERDAPVGQVRFINERAEDLLGYPPEQWLADPDLWLRIVHPDDRAEALRGVTAGTATGHDFALTYRVQAADGRIVWLRDLVHVVTEESGERRLHGVLIDITEQKRREESAALLAAAGRVLSGAGTVEERLVAIAELAVGTLGDWAAVWLRGEDDRYRVVAAAPASAAERMLDLPPVVPPDEFLARFREGRSFTVGDVTEEMQRIVGAEQLAAIAGFGVRSRLVAPLVAGGAPVGLLSCSSSHPDRRYDEADLALAEDLGRRIATTVAAERMAARQRHLHELTVALAAAGTAAEAGAALTAGLRRVLGASVVAVSTLGADGLLHLVDATSYPAVRRSRFAAMRLTAPFPLSVAARTGRPVWLPDRAAAVEQFPEAAPHLLETTEGSAALPLLVGGQVVGVLGVSFTTTRRFDAEERGFLLSVADQVAVALERAALADVRREMADTLQRSLLPGRLPVVERLDVTARYLPAVAGTRAGGDWYDVHHLGDGRVAVAVGDVVGNGATAAAVMGQLRSALGALLVAGHAPAQALELLDQIADEVPGAGVSTVACLQLDPASGELAYSRAGHPPALLVDWEGARYLDGGLGAALGLPHRGRRPEAVTRLAPGSVLLLYTDGLVERRGATLDAGLDRLAGAAAARRYAPLPHLVDGLLDELVDDRGAGDDIAVVAVRLLPAPLRLDLAADSPQLWQVRRAVGRWANDAALDPDTTQDLELALTEAVSNAVEHAYRDAAVPGRVVVTLDREPDGTAAVSVSDSGTWRPPPADPGFRGRGLRIIAALAADVDLQHGPHGTVVRFALQPAGSGASTTAAPVVPPPRTALDELDECPAALATTDAGDRRRVRLTGDLDLAGTAAVREALLTQLTAGVPTTLDLTGLRFVPSVGLGLLLEAARATRGEGDLDVVLPPAGPARRLLDLTGLAAALHGDDRPAGPARAQ
jgi:anti-anti-sigma factor